MVLESLLPEARKATDRQLQANARALQAQTDECKAMGVEFQQVLSQIQSAARASLIAAAGTGELAACIERYFDLVARIIASGRSDPPWQQMSKTVARAKPVLTQLRLKVEQLMERRAQNVGWLSRDMAIFVVAALLLLPILFNVRFVYLLAPVAAVAAWRLLPMVFLMRDIRELATKLATWIRPGTMVRQAPDKPSASV